MKYFIFMDTIFKQTLRSELDFQDIKVKELALRTGISQRTLEGYLSARSSIPPADVAVKIAQALNVSVEYLVTGNEKANPKNTEEDFAPLSLGSKYLLKEILKVFQNFDIQIKG